MFRLISYPKNCSKHGRKTVQLTALSSEKNPKQHNISKKVYKTEELGYKKTTLQLK